MAVGMPLKLRTPGTLQMTVGLAIVIASIVGSFIVGGDLHDDAFFSMMLLMFAGLLVLIGGVLRRLWYEVWKKLVPKKRTIPKKKIVWHGEASLKDDVTIHP